MRIKWLLGTQDGSAGKLREHYIACFVVYILPLRSMSSYSYEDNVELGRDVSNQLSLHTAVRNFWWGIYSKGLESNVSCSWAFLPFYNNWPLTGGSGRTTWTSGSQFSWQVDPQCLSSWGTLGQILSCSYRRATWRWDWLREGSFLLRLACLEVACEPFWTLDPRPPWHSSWIFLLPCDLVIQHVPKWFFSGLCLRTHLDCQELKNPFPNT